ncbi:23S rRNA (adenine(2030)-N(6))-methyltransferase RlmJ [Alcaligenaceae bacterium 429]|nr:23S rRNA (adenine(2030)-N(6))-methyltransferase RlmJ [Alcaligenaceae bacterium 429]
MFSYRHAFHAANHADVLKHVIYTRILDYYLQKETGFTVIDTHAGAGLYDLEHEWSQQSGECVDGLDRVIEAENVPEMVEGYLDAIAELNPDGLARYYPGSPWLAVSKLRKQDSFHGFELHPNEYPLLQHNLQLIRTPAKRRVHVHAEDGFKEVLRLMPPHTRRGIVIIDPSYEAKTDYKKVFDSLTEILKRFAQCCIVIWYPIVQREEVRSLQRRLEQLKVEWLHASLTVKAPQKDGFGLHGSGMFVINPPWVLTKELPSTMKWLAKTLAQDKDASFTFRHQAAKPVRRTTQNEYE